MKKILYCLLFVFFSLGFVNATDLSYGYATGYTNWSTTSCSGKWNCKSQTFYYREDKGWLDYNPGETWTNYCTTNVTKTASTGVNYSGNNVGRVYNVKLESQCHSARGTLNVYVNGGYVGQCWMAQRNGAWDVAQSCSVSFSERTLNSVSVSGGGSNSKGGNYSGSSGCTGDSSYGYVYDGYWLNASYYYTESSGWNDGVYRDWNYCPSGYTWKSRGSTRSISSATFYSYPTNATFDLNGYLDGATSGNISGYGTVDVYVNGTIWANDVSDFYRTDIPYGSTVQITDIKTTTGHTYNGVYSGSVSFTITGTTSTYLNFSTNQYTITVNPNGGTYNGSTSASTLSPNLIYGGGNWWKIAVATRDGYVLNGYYSLASGGTKIYEADGSNISNTSYWNDSKQYIGLSNLTVYAQWTAVYDVYQIDVLYNGNNLIEDISQIADNVSYTTKTIKYCKKTTDSTVYTIGIGKNYKSLRTQTGNDGCDITK